MKTSLRILTAAAALFSVSFAGDAAAAGSGTSTISGTLEVDASFYPGVYYWLRTPSGRVLLPVRGKVDHFRNLLTTLDGAQLVLQGKDISGMPLPVKGGIYEDAAFHVNFEAPLLVRGRLEAKDESHELRVTRNGTIAIEGVGFLEPGVGRFVWAKVKLASWVFGRHDVDDAAPLAAIAFLPASAPGSTRSAALTGIDAARGARAAR